MTFLEAAIEILRREGKPLPVRRLAELAIQHNLLSVVGRDPEGTMQARLAEVLDKGPTHAELLRVRPDLFGLRAYPPQPYPPVRAGVAEGTEAGRDDASDPTADAVASAEAEAELAKVERGGASQAEDRGPGGRRRRRRGRGAPGRNGAETPVNGSHARSADDDQLELAPVARSAASAAGSVQDAIPRSEEGGSSDAMMDEESGEFEVDADGASSAPLMVATPGDEELTRSGEEREVRSEILGRREERGRGRHGQRGRHERDQKRGRPDGEPQRVSQREALRDSPRDAPRDRPPAPPQAPAMGPSSGSMPLAASASGSARRTLGTELQDILRAQDGRPQHARALAQEIDRRKILEGRPQPEIVREVRMALYGDAPARAARGLRPRLRVLGGGNYAAVDRKLDEELLQVERGVEAALEKLHASTVMAVRRRLARLSPFSFEQLGRLCAESLGVERPTLVRRGEGVAYFGGERALGASRSKVLIGIRPGEGELSRRAIGELRAGLDARGFDEGVLFGLGRLSGEAREELRAGRAVTVYDGDTLASFLVEQQLGVRQMYAPIAYFDADFFAELNET